MASASSSPALTRSETHTMGSKACLLVADADSIVCFMDAVKFPVYTLIKMVGQVLKKLSR